MKSKYIAELDEVIAEFDRAESLTLSERNALATRCITAIERAGGRSSIYFERVTALLRKAGENVFSYDDQVIGVAKALRHDLKNDYITSFEELIHSNIFADYLEMAKHLHDAGYKDAAAVIAGSTLESHLRQMCQKFGVAIDKDGKPKKADAINAELYRDKAYSLMIHKNITAWLDLRNNAAHGKYDEYNKAQVALFIDGIRDFMMRHPA